ncbi:short-chain dehydrogenase [Rhexocercosporidium sp. MPI-PUGE-AT-0058]|nr:short-chain dehydrogenase [Rhexocercosporidium sp. MPI-PUGE-AT-0058]
MSGTLAGKTAVVTGGSKGIGKAIVKALAQQGAKVILTYLTDKNAADELAEQLGADRVVAYQTNSGSVEQGQVLVNTVCQQHGKIDILVLNAGFLAIKDLSSLTEVDFDKTINLNLKGPLFLVQSVVPYMPDGGRIIFLSTTQTVASTVIPTYLSYCASKGAVEQITRVLAKDLAKVGITVNAIAPGAIDTALFRAGKTEERMKQVAAHNPFNRIGQADEVADAVLFLAGHSSRWISGQVIRVNGGQA